MKARNNLGWTIPAPPPGRYWSDELARRHPMDWPPVELETVPNPNAGLTREQLRAKWFKKKSGWWR